MGGDAYHRRSATPNNTGTRILGVSGPRAAPKLEL